MGRALELDWLQRGLCRTAGDSSSCSVWAASAKRCWLPAPRRTWRDTSNGCTYVTNRRDNAFKATIQRDYPNIQIVAQQGTADPARAEDAALSMLTRTPDLDGIYVPWAEPAEHVLAALRNAGNTTTRIVTLDLSGPLALDMVRRPR